MTGGGSTETPSSTDRRVLVTGGAGFIGVWLCRELVSRGFDVVAVDDLRVTPLQPHAGLLVRRSVLDLELADLDDVTTVYHLASHKNVAESHDRPVEYLENVDAARHLLRLCDQAAVPRVVMASSCEVYGVVPVRPIAEAAPLAPRSPYARTKVALEMLSCAYQDARARGTDLTVARLFNVYGPGERPDAVIPALCRAAVSVGRVSVEGDGSQRRDFSFISDVIAKLGALLNLAGLPVVNIGSGRSASVLELVELIRALRAEVEVDWLPGRPHEIGEFLADTTLARHHFGEGGDVVDLNEGVRRTYDWWVERERDEAHSLELVGDAR